MIMKAEDVGEYLVHSKAGWHDKSWWEKTTSPKYEAIRWAMTACPRDASLDDLATEASNYLADMYGQG